MTPFDLPLKVKGIILATIFGSDNRYLGTVQPTYNAVCSQN